MSKKLQECHEYFVYWLFKDAANGKVLEVGDTGVTDEGLCPDLDEIQEETFDIIDSTPDERWVGGVGSLLSYNEVGLIGGIAICDAINEGMVGIDFVENFDLGADYDFAQN